MKSKSKKLAVKKAVVKKAASPFKVGQRVKVHYGEWGNAKGNVCGGGSDGEVLVLLDVNVRSGPVGFDAANLIAL